MPKTIKFDRFQRDPNARERTPEEASKARMWKGLGMAAGTAGALGLGALAIRHTSKPYPKGTRMWDGTPLETSKRLAQRTAREAAAKKIRQDAKKAAKTAARPVTKASAKITPGKVIEFRRNVARAVLAFQVRGDDDGQFRHSLNPLTAYRKGRRMVTGIHRAGEVAEDTGDMIAGRPRQPGKKRFYEKSWFKNAALGGAIGIGGIWTERQVARANGRKPWI